MHLIFLGSGASMGVPIIGCSCPVCTSPDLRNKRWRSSLLIKIQGSCFLIDAGPDLRSQALRYGVRQIDAVCVTHVHYDHVAGLDDLRPFVFQHHAPLPLLLSQASLSRLQGSVNYLFAENAPFRLDPQLLPGESGCCTFKNVELHYYSYRQMNTPVTGFRIGPVAYIPDIKEYPSTLIDELKGVEVLIVSALRFTSSPMHFTVDEAISFAQEVGAKATWLTHLAHDLDHAKTEAYLPDGMRVAYDGLELYL